MARTRSIKPSFFTNEYLAELKPLARLLFAGLWCIADREGRLEDRPKKIKVQILPYDDCNVDDLLNLLALSPEHFIVRYSNEHGDYIAITNFALHQNPHVKEVASTIQAPDLSGASTVQAPEQSNRVKVIGKRFKFKRKAGQIGIVKEIVDYLNLKAKTKYKSTSSATKELIRLRSSEKNTLDDFKTVIDKKCAEWIGTEFEKFLRPSTLFSTKFEGYLNQNIIKPKEKLSAKDNFEQREYPDEVLESLYKNSD